MEFSRYTVLARTAKSIIRIFGWRREKLERKGQRVDLHCYGKAKTEGLTSISTSSLTLALFPRGQLSRFTDGSIYTTHHLLRRPIPRRLPMILVNRFPALHKLPSLSVLGHRYAPAAPSIHRAFPATNL